MWRAAELKGSSAMPVSGPGTAPHSRVNLASRAGTAPSVRLKGAASIGSWQSPLGRNVVASRKGISPCFPQTSIPIAGSSVI
jgi:hypothetical protein